MRKPLLRFLASTNLLFAVAVVRIEGIQFNPNTIVIAPGDTVVFENHDLVPHTATQPGKGGFDSKTIEVGAKYRKRFDRAGVHDYLCKFHPTMKGRIEVRKPGGK